MRVPSPTEGRTRPSSQGLGYLQDATPDFSGLVRGIQLGAQALEESAAAAKAKRMKTSRFKALMDLNQYQIDSTISLEEQNRQANPGDRTFVERADASVTNLKNKYLASVDPELREEMELRAEEVRQRNVLQAYNYERINQDAFFANGINKSHEQRKLDLQNDPRSLEEKIIEEEQHIDATDLPEDAKIEAKQKGRRDLAAITYKDEVKKSAPARRIANAIVAGAEELGIDPVDFATVISYETGGKFSTSIRGGKGGKYLGIIQFGEEEQRQFGARADQTIEEQVASAVAFLKTRGFKPGMSILDLYSTINAGSPGRYGASDSPGNTVASHVEKMQREHRGKAEQLLGLKGGSTDLDAIDNKQVYADLTLEDRLAIRNDANAEFNKEMAAAEAARKERDESMRNGLYKAIDDGKAGMLEIEEFDEAGLFPDFDQRKKAVDLYEKRNAEAIAKREFAGVLNGSRIFDPMSDKSKDQFDAWVGKEGLARLDAGDQAYANDYLLPAIRKAHDIPRGVTGHLTGMVRSTDPKKQLFALDLMSRIHDEDPIAFNQRFTAQDLSDVNLWRVGRNYMDEKELYNTLRGAPTGEQRNMQQSLREQADLTLKNNTDPQFYDLKNLPAEFAPSWLSSTPALSGLQYRGPALARDFQTLFREEFARNGGNAEAARASTIQQMKMVWGVNEVGGVPTLMKNPPHLSGYRTFEGSYRWIEDQIRADFALPADAKFQIIDDQQTAIETKAFKAGTISSPPSYKVALLNPDGTWTVLNRPDRPDQEARVNAIPTPELQNKEKVLQDIAHQKAILQNLIPREALKIYETGGLSQESYDEAIRTIREQEQKISDMEKSIGIGDAFKEEQKQQEHRELLAPFMERVQ